MAAVDLIFRTMPLVFPGVAIIDDTLYIGRYIEESVFFSNDNGRSWTQIDNGLTDRGGPRLSAIGTTLFAQMWDHVFPTQSWREIMDKTHH